MILKTASAPLYFRRDGVAVASINDHGNAVIDFNGEEHHMTADELKDLWARLGVLIREFNKWNG